MAKNKKIVNKNEELTLNDIQPDLNDIFTSLIDKDPKEKQYKFYLYYLFGFPIKTCAELSDYAESTGYQMVQRYKKQPNLRQRVDEILNLFPDQYRAICKLRLPQVAEIEAKALETYAAKPRLAIDKPALLKQLKMGAGVDLGEPAAQPRPTTIKISELKVFWSKILGEDEPKKIEAEIISEKDD